MALLSAMWINVADSIAVHISPRSARRAGGRRPRIRRRQRALVTALLSVADATPSRDPLRRRFEVLLHDRVQEVRGDLLGIARRLEVTDDLDPECARELDRLLRDGCDSPLYNPDIHPSELRATLYHVRLRLEPLNQRPGASSASRATR